MSQLLITLVFLTLGFNISTDFEFIFITQVFGWAWLVTAVVAVVEALLWVIAAVRRFNARVRERIKINFIKDFWTGLRDFIVENGPNTALTMFLMLCTFLMITH